MGGRLCCAYSGKRHGEVAPLAIGEPSPTNEKAQDQGKAMSNVKSRLRLILDYIARFKKIIAFFKIPLRYSPGYQAFVINGDIMKQF